MNVLEFEIHGQILTRVDSHDIVNKNHNIYKCRFTFEENSEWDNTNKFVTFTDGWGNSSTQHLGKSSNILSCMIPDKMLKGSYFKISVYGGHLVTTNNLSISLIQSGYHKYNYHRNHPGKCYYPHHYDKYWHDYDYGEFNDIFVEIFDRLDSTIDSLIYDNNTLHIFNGNHLVESIYLPFVTEDDVNELMTTVITDYIQNQSTATSESNGLMSSEDKVKLDSIESGANYTIIDDSLDMHSDNAISNKAVSNVLDNINEEINKLDSDKEDKYDIIERIDNVIVELINKGN